MHELQSPELLQKVYQPKTINKYNDLMEEYQRYKLAHKTLNDFEEVKQLLISCENKIMPPSKNTNYSEGKTNEVKTDQELTKQVASLVQSEQKSTQAKVTTGTAVIRHSPRDGLRLIPRSLRRSGFLSPSLA